MDEKVFAQVVLAQHDCNDGTMRGQEYAFLVPFGMKLAKGDLVKVKTRRGEKLAKCTTDSLEVTEEILIMLQRVALGEHKEFTGKVLGKYEFVEPEDPEDEEVVETVIEVELKKVNGKGYAFVPKGEKK